MDLDIKLCFTENLAFNNLYKKIDNIMYCVVFTTYENKHMLLKLNCTKWVLIIYNDFIPSTLNQKYRLNCVPILLVFFFFFAIVINIISNFMI